MGQLHPPTRLSPDSATLQDEAVKRREARPDQGSAGVVRNRAILVTALAAAVAIVLSLTLSLAPAPQVEPELLQLLRGMVLIKGLIGLLVAGLIFWRLGRSIEPGVARGYVAAVCVSMAAVAWLWGLQLIPLGSLLFWSGLVAVALLARRDRLFDVIALPKSR